MPFAKTWSVHSRKAVWRLDFLSFLDWLVDLLLPMTLVDNATSGSVVAYATGSETDCLDKHNSKNAAKLIYYLLSI